jgi:hypothetical protein
MQTNQEESKNQKDQKIEEETQDSKPIKKTQGSIKSSHLTRSSRV